MTEDVFRAPSLLLLKHVEKRPGMYVGEVNADALIRLESVIAGYAIAVHEHGVRDAGYELYAEFSEYLLRELDWSMSQGPIRGIRSHCLSDQAAWNQFFELLWHFVELRSGEHFELS